MPDLAAISSASPRLSHRFLSPGDLLVLTTPCEITTILGPCVAVTFWCPHAQVGAICHAMLPSEDDGHVSTGGRHAWKYVRSALPEMWRRFLKKGGEAASPEVKLFGGADLLRHQNDSRSAWIGSQNVAFARQLLAERSLPILACDVGGKNGRKVIFNTQTGAVRVKRLAGTFVSAP